MSRYDAPMEQLEIIKAAREFGAIDMTELRNLLRALLELPPLTPDGMPPPKPEK